MNDSIKVESARIVDRENGNPARDDESCRRFQQLTRIWKAETAHLSRMDKIVEHQAYQEIIGLGTVAVPLILHELRRESDYWFRALEIITGDNPAENARTVDDAARAWLDWGERHGYPVG